MDLLVTGASGFVGRNFLLRKDSDWRVYAVYCADAGFTEFVRTHELADVHPVRCDLTTLAQVEGLRGTIPNRFDAILHLASNGDPAASAVNPVDDLRRGPLATVNLLSTFGCHKIVYFSSGAVYDGHKGLVGPDTRLNPVLPYAISKLASEQYVKAFRKNGRVGAYTIVRFFGAFGPHEPARKVYTKLVRFAMTAGPNGTFEVRGNGQNLIDAMYIDDATRGIKNMLKSDVRDEVVDFGTGHPTTINELVERSMKVLGRPDARIKHVGEVPEYNEFVISPERMSELFDFRPTTPLGKGLLLLKEHLEAVEVVK